MQLSDGSYGWKFEKCLSFGLEETNDCLHFSMIEWFSLDWDGQGSSWLSFQELETIDKPPTMTQEQGCYHGKSEKLLEKGKHQTAEFESIYTHSVTVWLERNVSVQGFHGQTLLTHVYSFIHGIAAPHN